MRKIKVLITGSPFHTKALVHFLKKSEILEVAGYPLCSTSCLLSLENSIRKYHLMHWISFDSTLILPSYMSRIFKKKSILHWIGGDVQVVSRMRRLQVSAKIIQNFIDANLSGAPWLVNELNLNGIRSIYVPLPPPFVPPITPLPDQFRILVYIPASYSSIYATSKLIEVVTMLAKRVPDVTYLIVGSKPSIDIENIKVLGNLTLSQMREVYAQVVALLRVLPHDGLSYMVLESLAAGRYVIWNYSFPYCIKSSFSISDLEQAIEYVRQKYIIRKLNLDGSFFVRNEIFGSKLLGTYEKIYNSLL